MRIHLSKHRRGFTLVELLIVVVIIAILAALTAAAVMQFSTTGPLRVTKANLGKIHMALTNQWKAVRDDASNGNYTESAFQTRALAQSGASSMASPKAKEWYVKLKLIQAFPTDFSEALAPAGDSTLAWPAYKQYLASLGITSTSLGTASPEEQRAVCLLMILEKGPKNGGLTADDLGSTCIKRMVVISTTEAPGIVDGWRNAVLFTRTYNGQDNSPALLSAGPDGMFGVSNLSTFAIGNTSQAKDNPDPVR